MPGGKQLTLVVYIPLELSVSTSLERPKSATLQMSVSLTRMFLAARSFHNKYQRKGESHRQWSTKNGKRQL